MNKKILFALALFFIVSTWLRSADAAPDITVGQKQGNPGQTLSIPVDFVTGGSSAHIQFDLFYNPSVLTPGVPALGSASVSHVVDSNVVGSGHLRCVIYSLSNDPLGSGRLIDLPVSIAPDALSGAYPISVAAVVISSPSGQNITPTLLASGSVSVAKKTAPIPALGPFGLMLLACLIFWAAIKSLKHRKSMPYRILVLFVLVNFTLSSAGLLPVLAAQPGDSDDDGDIDDDDIRMTVQVILEKSIAPGDPDCNKDGSVNVLDLPCLISNIGNSQPDLLPPGNREISVAAQFSSRLFAVDPDSGDELAFSLPAAPDGMTCDPATGDLAWTPLAADLGDHTVTARVTDNDGLSDSETFNIRVYQTASIGGENSPPDLSPIADQRLTIGESLNIAAIAADPDAGDVLVYSLPRGPAGMSINASSGLIQWTPAADQAGSHDVTVQVADPGGRIDAESFIVTVNLQNAAPTANSDQYAARYGETLTVAGPGLHENDNDPNHDPLSPMLLAAPSYGTLALRTDGGFDYTPISPDFHTESGVNMALWDEPAFNSSGTYGPNDYGPMYDGDLNTSWFADIRPVIYVEMIFERHDITIRELRMFGNRNPEEGRDFFSGIFDLFDRGGSLLYTSGEVMLPDPGDIVLDVGLVQNAYRIRFTGTSWEGNPGFSELQVLGDVEVLSVREEWSWTNSIVRPDYLQVMMSPIVGDVNADGIPDVVFGTYSNDDTGGSNFKNGYLRSVSGLDGSEIFTNTTDQILCTAQLAMADIDQDGLPEILALAGDRVTAFENNGDFKWEGPNLRGQNGSQLGAPSIADLDGDGSPEIIIGDFDGVAALNADGSLRWWSESGGSGGHTLGKFPVAVDLDLDGTPEIAAGNSVYLAADGTIPDWWKGSSLPDGFPAIANFDTDAYPEIVLGATNRDVNPVVYLLEHDGTVIWRYTKSGTTRGGPPTVADFDGDGRPEIGVAARNFYFVVDDDGTLLWEEPVYDGTSGVTASTVFDFENDGTADVVYGDERYLYVFSGEDGRKLFRTELGSGTAYEYPVVADVDADGQAEIIAVANIGDYGANLNNHRGVYVFGGENNNWVRTRQVWNQHAYHITNVNPDLTIPAVEQPNWLLSGLNNFRLNAFMPDESGRTDQFTYRAFDGVFESNEATVVIDILPPNAAPDILSSPETIATAGFAYMYGVVARDADQDPLTYSLAEFPTGMAIDPLIGRISWVPENANLGDHPVKVVVTDGKGGMTIQNFTLTVAEPVLVPDVLGETQADARTLISAAGLAAGAVTEGHHISVPAGRVAHQSLPAGSAAEPGSEIDLVLSLGPAPADIDNDGDEFTENQGDCNDADNTIHPGALDPAGDGIDQDCDGLDGNLPIAEIVIMPASSALLVGDHIDASAVAVFNDGTSQQVTHLALWDSLDPTKATVDALGHITATGAGPVTIQASLKGVTGSAAFDIHDTTPGDVTAPTAMISSPESSATITAPVNIIGIANDTNFLKFTLSVAPAGETNFTLLHTGTSPVVNGILGSFDTTLMINDLYTLRLTVYDRGGNISIVESVYQVAEDFKVGLFTLTFIDLEIPMSGIPIQILRTYDSRDKSKGDFGVGWQLNIQTLRCRTNRVLGTGWQVLKSGLAYQMFSTDFQKVSITLPDGKVEEFDMVISPNPSVIVPFSSVNASFTQRPGTTGKLECLDDTALLVIGVQPGDVTLTDFGANTFDPQNFRYTSLNGIQYVINKTEGVQRITEPNGNTLTFGPGGITHSSGKSVVFSRDALDRITSVTDPNGNAQIYTYDGNGNLNSHTDAETNTTRFFYNYRHGLLRIEDPLGRPVARSEYDDAGRLVASIDALGNRIEYTHHIGTRQEVVRDRLNGITVLEYDENGNVVSQTDPLGYTKTYTYDANGNTTSMTDPLGNVTTYTYDAKNLLLSETDPSGNTTSYTYNSRGRLLKETDPMGGVVTNTYDGAGNKLSTTDAEGHSKFFTYDAGGNLLTEKDPLGHVTSYAYDSFGNQTGITDALGYVTSFTYDNNGQQTSKSKTRTTPTGPETFTTQYQFDKAGRTVKVIDPLGGVAVTGYDTTGKKTYSDDKNGNRTSYEYDPAGNLIKTIFPDGAFETSSYDANGKRITDVNQNGEITSFTYDGLSRQISVTFPGGAVISNTYDGAGRMTAQTNALGHSILYQYDAAGRTTALTDPLGGVIHWSYDANGNTISITDANGNTTSFEYDQANRKIKTNYADGTSTVQSRDVKGKVISVKDQAGFATFYEYDKLGRLVRVIDESGPTTSYGYDEVGNMISSTDANGHATIQEYDHLGRVVKKILPLGMFETYAYDGNGNLIQKTDFNGQITTYTYDVDNQLVSEMLPDGSLVTYTYTANGLRESVIDGRGTTSYTYNGLNQLIQVTHPDGGFIAYAYDSVGNRNSLTTPSGTTTYTYDANNRLATVTSPDANVTSYTYHPAGNRASLIYPNGSVTTYEYDSLNRLVHQETRKSDTSLISSYHYTLGPAGNRIQVLENSGRTVNYTYDNMYRLIGEQITDPVLGNQTIAYTYDPVGNRLSKNDIAGLTQYTYDPNDRLLHETGPAGTLSYAYDSNGNTISAISGTSEIYSYDSKNRLTSVDGSSATINYDYDADGIRVQSTVNGQITKFLVDANRQYAQVLDVLNSDDSLIASYTYGDDLISQKKDSQVSFYAYDGLGSTRHLLNQTENITDAYVYDAFGLELGRTGVTENNYLYAGEQYDPDLDRYYLRARYYGQNTGRFMTTDPRHGELRDPVSLHKYAYARNNPVDFTDPSGELAIIELSVVIFIIGVVFVNIGVLTRSPKESIQDAGLYYIQTEQGPKRIEVGKPIRDIIFDAGGENKAYSHWEEFLGIVGKFYDAVDDPDNYSIQCNDISQIIDEFDGTFHRDVGAKEPPSINTSKFDYFYLKSNELARKHYYTTLHLKGSQEPLIVLDPIGITLTGQYDNAEWAKRYYIWTWDEYSSSIIPLYE